MARKPLDIGKLSDKLREIKKQAADKETATLGKNPLTPDVIFIVSQGDTPKLPYLKNLMGGTRAQVTTKRFSSKTSLQMFCKERACTKVFCTQAAMLKVFVHKDTKAAPKLSDYEGSYFKIAASDVGGLNLPEVEVVFLPELYTLFTRNYGEHLMRRYISKHTQPEKWSKPIPFKWEIAEHTARMFEIYDRMANALFVAVDIETIRLPLWMVSVSYTAVYVVNGKFESETVVIRLDGRADIEWGLAWVKKINLLPTFKVLQNGKYDHAYFARFGAPCRSWYGDTATMFHSWYSELPKDLGFLNAYFMREGSFWKDLAESGDLQTRLRYNALDTWATANVWIIMLLQAPDWAWKNYRMEFPVNFPAHMCEMHGIERDMGKLAEAKKEAEAVRDAAQAELNTMLGMQFNVMSPPQVKALLHMLGCGDLSSTGEAKLRVAMFRHPLNERILELVLVIRKQRTLISTYLTAGKEFVGKDVFGDKRSVVLYSLNPHGTDTGRLASGEHAFWCGFNIQNQPRGKAVKQTYVAPEGFYFAESDLEQAESRDTAYIAGEPAMIAAVSGDRDFHSMNAAAFFMKKYEDIYDVELHKTKNKPLRDKAKRVNHGANYVMGNAVLVETMGLKDIYEAGKVLGVSAGTGALKIGGILLERFHHTYPGIRGNYYPWVKRQVDTFHRLFGATGWTRYCFGKPSSNKRDFNTYVAHNPQSLNAMKLNKAFMRVFLEIAMHPEHGKNFRLLAQIHDSIFYAYREGHEYLNDMVVERMQIPVAVTGCDGVTRAYTVPAEAKCGTEDHPAKYWSETE